MAEPHCGHACYAAVWEIACRHPAGDRCAAGRPLLVATRIGLWIGVQLVVAGLLIVSGAAAASNALNAAAGWWMVYAAVVDLGTLGVIGLLIHRQRDGISYRGLLGPPAAGWQVGLGALGVLAASVPAVACSIEVTKAFYGDATLPMFAMVDVPVWASLFGVLVVSVLTELAEPVAYLGGLLPWLERRLGRSWLAAAVVVVIWAVEHAFAPLLTTGGGLDLVTAWCRCCPSWLCGPRSTTRSAGGCCRSWLPGGSSMPARLLPWH